MGSSATRAPRARRGWPLAKLRDVRAARLERDNARGVSRRAFLKGAGAITAATAVPAIFVRGRTAHGRHRRRRHRRPELRARARRPRHRQHGLRSLGPHRRPHVHQHRLLEREPDHRVVRRTDRHAATRRSGGWQSASTCRSTTCLAPSPIGPTTSTISSAGTIRRASADQDFLAVSDSIAADAEAAGFPTTFDSNTAAGRALDRMSVHEYIERRIPGGHRSPLGALLDVGVRHRVRRRFDRAVGAQPDFPARVSSPQPHSLSVFGESDEKFHIRGGNQQLPEAMARYLGGDRRQDGPAPGARQGNARTAGTKSRSSAPAARARWSPTSSCWRCRSRCWTSSISRRRASTP